LIEQSLQATPSLLYCIYEILSRKKNFLRKKEWVCLPKKHETENSKENIFKGKKHPKKYICHESEEEKRYCFSAEIYC